MLREGRLAKELGLGVGEPCTRAPQPEGQSTPVSWGRSLQGAAWLGQHVTGPSLGQEGSGDLAGPRTGFLPPQGTLSLPCPAGFDGSSNNSLPVFALFQGLFQGLALCSDLDACVDLRSDSEGVQAGLEGTCHLRATWVPSVSHEFPASIVKELSWLVGFALATGWPLGAGPTHRVSVSVPFDGLRN